MSDVIEIYDASGQLRRPGTLLPPTGFVSSFPPYAGEAERPLWDDADIRSVLTDPRRTPREVIFDASYWIRNQGMYSSCNGYATAAALSKARFLRGVTDKLILSGTFIYSLINGGRDAGSMLEDSLRVVQKYGAPPESLVGQAMIYQRLQPKSARTEALKHVGLEAYKADTKQGWISGLAAGFMGVAVVHAGRNFSRMRSLSTGTSCAVAGGVDDGSGNHAVNIVDVRFFGGTLYFLLDNSWSVTGYGSQGRAWVTWEAFEQCFAHHVFYLIPSSQEA